jgi:FkbM family methyltransferase
MNLIGRCPPSSDMSNWYSIFERFSYKPVIDLIKDRQAPLKIIDAGAYVGYASAYFAENLPRASILAVEPDEENYHFLLKNSRNLLHIFPCWGAVWSKSTVLSVHKDYKDKKEWSYYCKQADGIGISGKSIHEHMASLQWNHLDILKMDIEGGEFEIFKHTAWLDRVDIVVMEIHHDLGNPHDIYNAFKKHKFNVSQAGELTLAVREGYDRG